jgi:hypothetical protein
MIVLQIIVFLLGLLITLATLSSAIRQTVLPGRMSVRLFLTTFLLFRLVIVRIHSEAVSSALAAFYAPISVMLLPITWVILL